MRSLVSIFRRVRYFGVGLVAVAMTVSVGGALYYFSSAGAPVEQTAQAFESVEIGIAEKSPRGDAGGLAIPASGASTPTCDITFDQNPVTGTTDMHVSGGDWVSYVEETGANTTVLRDAPRWTSGRTWTVPVGAPSASGEYDYYAQVTNGVCWWDGTHKMWTCDYADDSCTATLSLATPDITFEHQTRPAGSGTFSAAQSGDLTGADAIDVGTDVRLSWDAVGADTCTAVSGNGFDVSGTSGTDDITPPPPGVTDTYTIRCSNTYGDSDATILVETKSFEMAAFESDWGTPSLTWQNDWSSADRTIFETDHVRFRWDTTVDSGVDSCTLRADTNGDGVFTTSEASSVNFDAPSDGAGAGQDETIVEPSAGDTYGFEVSCETTHSDGNTYTTPPRRIAVTGDHRVDLEVTAPNFSNPVMPSSTVAFSTYVSNLGALDSDYQDVTFTLYEPGFEDDCSIVGTVHDDNTVRYNSPLPGRSAPVQREETFFVEDAGMYCISSEVETTPNYNLYDTNPSNNLAYKLFLTGVFGVSLTAQPTVVNVGESVTLTADINGNDPDDCTLSGGPLGSPGLTGSSLDSDGDPSTPEVITVNNIQSTVQFNLTCEGADNPFDGVAPMQETDTAEVRLSGDFEEN